MKQILKSIDTWIFGPELVLKFKDGTLVPLELVYV